MPAKTPRGGIERRILTSIFIVGVLPVALALVVGYLAARYGQGKAVEQALQRDVKKTALGVRLAAKARLDGLARLTADPRIRRLLLEHDPSGATPGPSASVWEAARACLATEAVNGEDGPPAIAVYDRQANLLLASEGLPPPPLADAGGPNSILVGASVLSVGYDPVFRRYTVTAAGPVRAPGESRPIGFVVETFGINSLLRYALGMPFARDGEQDVIDTYQIVFMDKQSGVMVASDLEEPPYEEGYIPRLDPAPLDTRLARLMRDPATRLTSAMPMANYATPAGLRDVFLAYHRVFDDEDIYIAAYRPAADVFTNINLGALLALGISVFVIACLCVNAYRNVHNNIVRQVLLLNEGAQIIRQGDLDLKLKIDTGDEIEELAQSFNKMALALNRNIKRLAESEEKYRNLVNSMRDGIYQTDADGLITFLNPAGVDILGYASAEEAVGHNLREFFLEEIDFALVTSELGADEVVERSRIWMKRKSGRTICVELSANLVRDDEGEAVGAEGTFRDVTKGVHLEQQARERSERISAINQIANVINSSLEAGRVYESLAAEFRKLVDFDYAALALLDEQGEGFDARQLWPEAERGRGHAYRLSGAESTSGTVLRAQECLVLDDLKLDGAAFASEFPEDARSCVCVPLYAEGGVIGTLNLASYRPCGLTRHDAAILEQLAPHVAVAIRNAQLLENLQESLQEVTLAREELHRANEELKTLDEMKTNLLSNVSHELRTPLVSIMGYTDMMLNEKAGPVNEVQREYLGISLRNIEKLVTLIENLLDFSRLHRGAEQAVFDVFDLADCVRSSIQIVQPVAVSRDISIELSAPEDSVPVEGDKSKMGQVFNNLLSNAVKFNRNGGTVTVELRPAGEEVEVTVSDTGIGIPPEALDKVFTRFYQYDSSSTRKYGGTGIGLSIAQDIVRLHGSSITVTSEPGRGSTFRFSLPMPADETAGGPLAQETAGVSETRLLIELVTRDRALTAQIRNLLVAEGMDVIHAADEDHALSLATKHRPDCILVDLDTGNGAGEAVLNRLLDDQGVRRFPLVALTNDEQLGARYGRTVAARVKRSFRKSGLLSGISHALNRDIMSPPAESARILCVDDDPEVLTFMVRCLEEEGYRVDTCHSGARALEMLQNKHYSLVLLDIAMPGMDGWEACRRIKTGPAAQQTTVFMVTAKPVENSVRVREAGAEGYILKPFRSDELTEIVRNLTALHAVEDS